MSLSLLLSSLSLFHIHSLLSSLVLYSSNPQTSDYSDESRTPPSGLKKSQFFLDSMLVYKQMSSHWTSTPEKGDPHGIVHQIEIENGKGKEEINLLGKTGKVLKHKSKSLKKKNINAILFPNKKNTTRNSKSRKSTRYVK